MSAPAPCGTFTAYKRHKRNGEPVDDACAQAARDQKNARKDAERAAAAATVPRPANPEPDAMTRLDVLYALRKRLFNHIDEAAPQNVAPIAGQLRAVASEIADLVGESAEPVDTPESIFDELAQKRSKRAS